MPAAVYSTRGCVACDALAGPFPQRGLRHRRLFGFRDLIVSVDCTDHVSASWWNWKALSPFRRLRRLQAGAKHTGTGRPSPARPGAAVTFSIAFGLLLSNVARTDE